MSRLAICVPTFNHPRVVEHIICYSAAFLKNNGVDIYYYDSSTGDETKQIIDGIRNKGFDNVYHIDVSPELNFGQKVDLIFSGYGLTKEYDYIWPVKDRIIHVEYTLQLVLDRCNKTPEADVLVVLASGDLFSGYYVDIDAPSELYKLFGKQTTSIGTVVYNMRSMLGDYEYGTSLSAPRYKNDFWHFDHLYRKLARMSDPVISIISKEGAVAAESNAAGESGWRRNLWKIWIEEWIQLNYELPDIYAPHKLQVIKDTTSINEIFGSEETLEKLYEDGLLTTDIYYEYEDMWDYVTTVPKKAIEKIARGEGRFSGRLE